MQSPYDGHTLGETIEQVEILAEKRPGIAIVDKSYRGAQVDGVRILRSGQRRGLTRTMKAMIRRRNAPDLGGNRFNGGPKGRVFATVLLHHAHSAFAYFRGKPIRFAHDSISGAIHN